MLQTLIAIAARHASPAGAPTQHPRLTIRCTGSPTPPNPALFEPKFYLLLQGAKRMTIAGNTFDCSAGSCAVASVGLPFVSEVVKASSTEPYLSVELKLDASILTNLRLDMREENSTEAQQGAITLSRAEVDIVEPIERLLKLLDSPSELPVLAAQYERELYFRLLSGPLGGRLRQIGANNSRFSQIKMAAEWIGQNASSPMSVEWLASHVGMSVTSFHRHFKAVTASSPLAYQRQLRLLEARRRLSSGEANVTEAAFASGYVSASQFSREYKSAFGVPPSRDATRQSH
jgi:AraC-like DNA-binding protein